MEAVRRMSPKVDYREHISQLENDPAPSITTAADYIPVVASIKSLVEIFRKYVLRQDLAPKCDRFHVIDKTFLERALLLIPVIGNLAVYFFSSKDPVQTLKEGKSLRFGACIRKEMLYEVKKAISSKGSAAQSSQTIDLLAKIFSSLEETENLNMRNSCAIYMKCGETSKASKILDSLQDDSFNEIADDLLKAALFFNQKSLVTKIFKRMLHLKIEANSFDSLVNFVTDKNVSIICDLMDNHQDAFKRLLAGHPLRFFYDLHRDTKLEIQAPDNLSWLIYLFSNPVECIGKFEFRKQMLLKLMEKVPNSLPLVRDLIMNDPEKFNDQGSLAIIKKATKDDPFTDQDLDRIFTLLSRCKEVPTLFLKKFPEKREYLFILAIEGQNANLIIALLKQKGLNKDKIDEAARKVYFDYFMAVTRLTGLQEMTPEIWVEFFNQVSKEFKQIAITALIQQDRFYSVPAGPKAERITKVLLGSFTTDEIEDLLTPAPSDLSEKVIGDDSFSDRLFNLLAARIQDSYEMDSIEKLFKKVPCLHEKMLSWIFNQWRHEAKHNAALQYLSANYQFDKAFIEQLYDHQHTTRAEKEKLKHYFPNHLPKVSL